MPPLPPPPGGHVPLPIQPQNPPILADVVNALQYTARVRGSHLAGEASNVDVARAVIYEAAIIAEHNPIVNAAQLTAVERTASIAYNWQCGNGQDNNFRIVPFPNGEDPRDQGLPPLWTEADIEGLNGPEATQYLEGYGVQPIPRLILQRRRSIRIAVGCQSGLR